MRRLVLLVCAVVLVDTMLFAALAPLLPQYADEFGLSKTGAGVLVAAYAIGVLASAFPAGAAAARFGGKRAALAGLVVVGAASFGFAFAGDAWTLGIARFAQGLGSALAWAGGLSWLIAVAPRERRAELLGTTLGAAIFGALLGPVLGGAAAVAGSPIAFSAVGVGALALAAAGARMPSAPRERPSLSALGRALRDVRFVGGLWLMFLPALLFGLVAVLVPLDLDRLGWSEVAIGGLFLVTAGLEAVAAPLVGRVVDRRGAFAPIRAALAASVVFSLALGWANAAALIVPLVLVASVAYGSNFTPGLALLSQGAERVGLPQGLAFGMMNGAWAVGAAIGPSVGGALGDAVGDPVAYGLGAATCAATLLALLAATASGTHLTRVPEHP